jgi:predicted DNA-binding transcriptional regulator YafY
LQEGAWLLVTRDHARGEVRRFRLSRIQKVKSTGATFEPPRDFDVKKYLRESLGRYGGTEEHEVLALGQLLRGMAVLAFAAVLKRATWPASIASLRTEVLTAIARLEVEGNYTLADHASGRRDHD